MLPLPRDAAAVAAVDGEEVGLAGPRSR
jgi:hypothetical protein